MVSERQIVWSPLLGKQSLAVVLSHSFAQACRSYQLRDPTTFTAGVWSMFGPHTAIMPSNFLDFDQGLLPKALYSGRGDGLWLARDMAAITSTECSLVYHGHNEDRRCADREWLLQAFGAWAQGAMLMLGWE